MPCPDAIQNPTLLPCLTVVAEADANLTKNRLTHWFLLKDTINTYSMYIHISIYLLFFIPITAISGSF